MKIFLQFDGGCRPTNPGDMYGSFLIERDDGTEIMRVSRLELGHGTNNEAEFLILETALDKLLQELAWADFKPKAFFVEIQTDSMIVRRRISNVNANLVYDDNPKLGDKKRYNRSRSNRMSQLAMRCHRLLAAFAGHSIQWQSRERNVEAFGH